MEHRTGSTETPLAGQAKPKQRIGAWPVITGTIVALVLAPLVYVACFTRLEYFDTFDLLVNAKRIAYHARDLHWKENRTPLASMLHVPSFLIERLTGIPDLAVRLGHLFGVVSFGILLFVTFKVLRREFDSWLAWLAVAWTALNPLLVHYAPMGREDIATVILIILAFDRYLAACESRRARDYYVSGLLCGLGMAMKYNLIPLLMGTIAAYELIAGYTRFRRGEMLATKLLALLVLPVCMFFVFPIVAFRLSGRATILLAPAQLIADIKFLFGDLSRFTEDPNQYYAFLIKAVSLPVVVLCLVGIMMSLQQWRKPGRWLFYLLWVLFFFYFQMYFIAHKEARYLFVIYLPVYYFALVAVSWLAERIRRAPAVVRMIGAAALLVAPVWMTARELSRFRDPIYWVDFEPQVSRAIATFAGPHRIWWFGNYFPVYPKDYVFDVEDEFTSIYHMGGQAIEVYTGKPVEYLSLVIQGYGDPTRILYDNPGYAAYLGDGDVVILNPANFVDTMHMEPERTPLYAQNVRVIEFKPQQTRGAVSASTAPSSTEFRSNQSDAVLWLIQSGNRFEVQLEGTPDGPAVLVARSANKPILGAAPIIIRGGKASSGFVLKGSSDLGVDGFAIIQPNQIQEFRLPLN